MQKFKDLNKLLDDHILINFSNTPLQSDIIGGLTRQPPHNLHNLDKSSPLEYQDFNIPMLNKNASIK